MSLASLMKAEPIRIETWNAGVRDTTKDDMERLAAVLHACVRAGASVSFVLPFSYEEAKAFWRDGVFSAVADGSRRLLIARSAESIVGTVQLDLATPPNQPHRAEVRKLLVDPSARRRGIGRSLMNAVEEEARKAHRTLLTLDTVTGGPAESLYRSLGYSVAGVVPGYALNYDSSLLESTTVMYKELTQVEAAA
jgi:ribosomal protein S18 acetylase RimI-like enzyme